jgi:hypothetical protein
MERPPGNAPGITRWQRALVSFRMGRVERVDGFAPTLHGLEGQPTATVFHSRSPRRELHSVDLRTGEGVILTNAGMCFVDRQRIEL